MGSLPHKFKCEDLVEDKLYVGCIIGHRKLDLYVAAKPPEKDFIQLQGADGFFRPLDMMYFWTSDLDEVPDWLDRLADADHALEKELMKRAEKRRKRKK